MLQYFSVRMSLPNLILNHLATVVFFVATIPAGIMTKTTTVSQWVKYAETTEGENFNPFCPDTKTGDTMRMAVESRTAWRTLLF